MKASGLLRGILCCSTLFVCDATFSEEDGRALRIPVPQTRLGFPINTYFNRNNISTVFWNNGYSDIDVQDLNAGFVYPKGSGRTAVFQSGFLWGGKIGGETRVGGSAYRTGLQGGKILAPGVPEDPNLPKNRIYRVRPDYLTGDLSSEVRDEGISADSIRANYARDWNEWPWFDGAPFVDANDNGVYDPSVDTPGVRSAAMTIWFVANDLDSAATQFLYGSLPLSMELQVTIWGYSGVHLLDNVIFKNYLMINRSTATIDSLFITQWADPDIGYPMDDFAGCDTARALWFALNEDEDDEIYSPLSPPAAGFTLLQGPVAASPGDTALFRGRRIAGFRNLPMTAHY